MAIIESLRQTPLGLPPAALEKLAAIGDHAAAAVAHCRAAGVKLGLGTDLFGALRDQQSREFEVRARHESSLDVLRSATSVNAELIGLQGEVGTLRAGAAADIIAVSGDPVTNVGVLADPQHTLKLVVHDGRVILNQHCKELLLSQAVQPGPRLGIDVGGTNTDAVVMVGDEVIAAVKRLTTRDVGDGRHECGRRRARCRGRTPGGPQQRHGRHDAIHQRFRAAQASRARRSRARLVPKADGIPPMVAWPQDLLEVVGEQCYMVGGGSFYDGKAYAPLGVEELQKAAHEIRKQGIRSIAVTSNFAPVRPDIEQHAAKVLLSVLPEADITPLQRSRRTRPHRSRERRAHQRIAAQPVAQRGQLAASGVRTHRRHRTDLPQSERPHTDLDRLRDALPDRHLLGRSDQQHSRRGVPDEDAGRDRHPTSVARPATSASWCAAFPRETATHT
jgi:hypothetical protein